MNGGKSQIYLLWFAYIFVDKLGLWRRYYWHVWEAGHLSSSDAFVHSFIHSFIQTCAKKALIRLHFKPRRRGGPAGTHTGGGTVPNGGGGSQEPKNRGEKNSNILKKIPGPGF